MMKRVSEAEEAGLNLTCSKIPKTHFRMAWLKCILKDIKGSFCCVLKVCQYICILCDILTNVKKHLSYTVQRVKTSHI